MVKELKEDKEEEDEREIQPMNFNYIVMNYLVNAPEGPRSQRIARFRTFLALVKCETDVEIPNPPNILNIKRQFQQSKYGRIMPFGSPENEDDDFTGEFGRHYREALEIELMQSVADAVKKLYDKKLITYETLTYAGGFIPIGDEEGNIIGERKLPGRR